MIDDKMPIIMVIAQDNVHQKCLNALEQVMARYGRPLVICQDNDTKFLNDEKYKSIKKEPVSESSSGHLTEKNGNLP